MQKSATALKPRWRVATRHGGSSTTNLFQALEEYLPALIGLAEEGSELRSKVQFVWANNLYGSPSICIYESGCAQLGYLDSVDSYMNLQVANTEKYIDGQLSGNLGEILIVSRIAEMDISNASLIMLVPCKVAGWSLLGRQGGRKQCNKNSWNGPGTNTNISCSVKNSWNGYQ